MRQISIDDGDFKYDFNCRLSRLRSTRVIRRCVKSTCRALAAAAAFSLCWFLEGFRTESIPSNRSTGNGPCLILVHFQSRFRVLAKSCVNQTVKHGALLVSRFHFVEHQPNSPSLPICVSRIFTRGVRCAAFHAVEYINKICLSLVRLEPSPRSAAFRRHQRTVALLPPLPPHFLSRR